MSHLGSSLDAVFLVDEFEDDTHIHIVMELCDGGTLMDAVTAVNSTEEDVSLVMRSVFRFLALCHSKDAVYRCRQHPFVLRLYFARDGCNAA